MKVVSNSGPLINLAEVGGLPCYRTYSNASLSHRKSLQKRRAGSRATWSNGNPHGPLDCPQEAQAALHCPPPDSRVDQGEAEAIALALQEKADWLLIDERIGRRFAQRAGLKVKGTLGVLVEGVRRGLIEDLRPLLDELVSKGTWIAPATAAQVLALAQEILQAREKKPCP